MRQEKQLSPIQNHKATFFQRLDAWDKRVLLQVSKYQRAPIVFLLRVLCRLLDPMIITLVLSVIVMGGARRLSEHMAITLFFSSLAAYAVKRTISRPRPNYDVRASKPPDAYSFPSGHTTIAFALLIVLWTVLPNFQILLFVLTFLVAASRIYLGVHYPLDVFGGFIVGSISGFIMKKIFTIGFFTQYFE